jgi:Xaa-Pro aminopeptidase
MATDGAPSSLTSVAPRAALPIAADFAAPPAHRDRARWAAADHAARPARLARLRERFAGADVDAYFGVRRENIRYVTGFELADGEEKVAGVSGQFLVGHDDLVILADSRYAIQARREAPAARVEEVYGNLPERWPALVGAIGARRVALEAGFVPHATWQRLTRAAPDIELVPVEGWIEADRATKSADEIERIAAACAVADRALASVLPRIQAGVTEAAMALELEWQMRTNGAEALAFDVACLAGPEAALPHGTSGDRPILEGSVLLFDFGAQVAGYRSDMTRTLFVGEPRGRDLEIYELVARAQQTTIDAVEDAARNAMAAPPTGRQIDAVARAVIEAAGHGDHFGHGTGHGIGLATHELPSLSRTAPDAPLPTPTVFSVEPGVYLEGELGVRIEDLVAFDVGATRAERLTHFPRDVLVVGR